MLDTIVLSLLFHPVKSLVITLVLFFVYFGAIIYVERRIKKHEKAEEMQNEVS